MAEKAPTREQLERRHTRSKIAAWLNRPRHSGYLSDFVYGGIDGAVTTFAVVSGSAGANLSAEIIIILGFANLIGDGFSMAAGNFLGTRVDQQIQHRIRQSEGHEIDVYPEGEREEIRQIFAAKGFSGDDLERAVEIITSNRERWIETMLVEEHGLSIDHRSPLKAAGMTMFAFVLIGLIPLLPFVVSVAKLSETNTAFQLSTLFAGVAFFSVGAIKSRFVQQRWYWAGLETLVVGGVAAALAYVVGIYLGYLIP
jgi:VIT1/CCC1 family predicted Fe2+/Mn2+ transporter